MPEGFISFYLFLILSINFYIYSYILDIFYSVVSICSNLVNTAFEDELNCIHSPRVCTYHMPLGVVFRAVFSLYSWCLRWYGMQYYQGLSKHCSIGEHSARDNLSNDKTANVLQLCQICFGIGFRFLVIILQ